MLQAFPTNSIATNLAGSTFKIDSNNNGEIEISEASQVKGLNIPQESPNLFSIEGIQNFTNLQALSVRSQNLTTIDVSSLILLKSLAVSNNNLTTIDVTTLINLEVLSIDNNNLTTIDISELINLKSLSLRSNNLTVVDVSALINLQRLDIRYNSLTSIDVSPLINLQLFWASGNQLTSLNLSGLSLLNSVECDYNQLSSINVDGLGLVNDITFDCSNNLLTTFDTTSILNLRVLRIDNNPNLVSLLIKNGSYIDVIEIFGNPSLQYICCDESEILYVQNIIDAYNYTNCSVNSYCSFTPGGTFYTIQGSNKFDSNTNGCDLMDSSIPNLKYIITNGSITGNTIANSDGDYSIPVQAGTYTITPDIENPTYFNVSPSSINVSFPTQPSPFTQNFCVTPNGFFPDLEITLLPINAARPGFDATYKIIYKNKGNTTQSGTVNLVFNDAVLDLVVSNPVVTSQSANNLLWAFTNLLPFETREITLTLNINSPMETPAVNGGDILNYTTTINSPAIDDLPNDNTFIYNQTVVNSFDPNDKTCLEGATITPTKVGDYVHYMIRFENNGTANAQNIVVKDMIDLAKFDINSIVPIKGSHSFVTNITAGNKVEFIFQNINLPFADATNDGYVSFKIKTKPTLVLGNTFSNSASIYFDYNFPIVTNTATTTIAVLAIQDFEFKNYFNVYPNPVSDILNLTSKENIEVSSISIYNTLGQLILVIPNAQNTKIVDVSSLTVGNFLLK